MGFLAPAVPWIIKGGAALGGMIAGKKAQSSAMQRSPEEAAALSQATNAGIGLQQTGNQLLQRGQSTLSQPISYYQALLGGDRAKMAQATSAPRGAIVDTFRGAERGLERSNVQGAQRDVASAELNRDRANQIAQLTTGVQPGAAAALSNIGTTMTGQGGAMAANAGELFSNLLGQGYNNRVYAREEGEKAGKEIGSLLFDVLNGTIGGVGKKKATGPVGGGYHPTPGNPNVGPSTMPGWRF